MPSIEDRRAIAKTLRRVAAINTASLSDGELMDFMMEIVLGGDVRMDPQDPDAEFLCCLADLIEPEERTCHNLGTYGGFECSMCGFKEEQLSEMECEPQDWCFCPNCGAKVVEE